MRVRHLMGLILLASLGMSYWAWLIRQTPLIIAIATWIIRETAILVGAALLVAIMTTLWEESRPHGSR
jgi:hypothetical protein